MEREKSGNAFEECSNTVKAEVDAMIDLFSGLLSGSLTGQEVNQQMDQHLANIDRAADQYWQSRGVRV